MGLCRCVSAGGVAAGEAARVARGHSGRASGAAPCTAGAGGSGLRLLLAVSYRAGRVMPGPGAQRFLLVGGGDALGAECGIVCAHLLASG